MPIGSAVHERTLALCESLNYREWSGFYAVSVYETHHEHEYNAIRNAAALIDVSPLYKYRVTGPDATQLVNRIITRDIQKVAVDQVIYCCWCDEHGKVIDDGTITRLGENTYRWTAAEPNLRWFHQNALGMDVQIEDISEQVAALALQGPTSAKLLRKASKASIDSLKYFRVAHSEIAGVPVDVSRTGYTGDLGYEVWMPWSEAVRVWDALMEHGREFDVRPCGMLALDVARIEAGLILIDVDYTSCRKALIPSQQYSPFEIGLGRLVQLQKENFVGRAALAAEQAGGRNGNHQPTGGKRRLVGLELDWDSLERLFQSAGLAPQLPATASRVAVPVYSRGRKQVGKATSTTWSPTLKKMIALASVSRDHAQAGTQLDMELTVEAVRHTVPAKVVELPFFNPPRKTATPPV
ncbi:MAG TPA: aminomethyltransferase family protein [Terriglobia bacterium]|nr:aminomethyltransferase family protein [Terriglobia bacterium]